MKRLELIISRVRELSQNTRYDSDSGLSQGIMVQYIQNAQDALVKAISISKCKYLLKTTDPVTVVNGQEEYDYPSDLFMRNIDTVEWALSPQDIGWIPLYKCISKDRFSTQSGYPFGYILQEASLIITPPLSSGYLRYTYSRQPRNLQIRMGQLSAVTVGGGNVTALTINPAEASFDPTSLNLEQVLCVVSATGTIKAAGIPFTSVNTTTGVFTISSHALASGEAVAAGDYVCAGEYVVNKPEWPDIVESFLIKHGVYEAKYGDSSQWTTAAKEDVSASVGSLVQSFALMSDDITEIPITNSDLLQIW